MKSRDVWRAIFFLLSIFITWQTLTPDPDNTKPSLAIAEWIAKLLFHSGEQGDKVAHFCAYAALGATAAMAQFSFMGKRSFIICILALYGVVLEGLQGLGGVRDPELADALANSLGALSAFPLAIHLSGIALKKVQP